MHITYRYERNLTYVELDNSNSKQTPQSIMSLIDNRISELRKEEAAIRHICVKLSQFLQANSITPFNDDMIEYMRHFINEEKQKQRAGTDNTEVILGLEQMLKDYTDEVNLYTKSISSQATSMSSDNFDNAKQIDEIYTLVRQLYELPINGKLIEDQVTQMNRGREQAATLDEQYVDLPTAANSPRILLDLKDIVDRKKR
jgi:hypothetical protein